MDARQAHAALSVRPVKTDQNDARGLAEMVRMGWYREVKVKTLSAHEQRGLLMARQRLIVVRRQIEGQVRGLLKQVADRRPSLSGAIHSLLDVLAAAAKEIASLDKQVGAMARANTTARRRDWHRSLNRACLREHHRQSEAVATSEPQKPSTPCVPEISTSKFSGFCAPSSAASTIRSSLFGPRKLGRT